MDKWDKFDYVLIGLILSGIIFLLAPRTVSKPPVEYTVLIHDTIYVDNEYSNSLTVTATCYNAAKSQCNSEYWVTADMSEIDTIHPNKHRWIAVSRDLLEYINMGDTVEITGTWVYDGKWVVKDKMNKRWSNKIDFLVGESMYMDKWENIQLKY